MTTEIMHQNGNSKAESFELALVAGDLSKLTVEERLSYYRKTCESLGLNELTKPFAYISLNGKLVLYALRDATDQLRKLHKVSITIVSRERVEDVYVVTAQATLPDGRIDESTGAVTLGNLKGDSLANALMKAETKAKRRVTLSIVGLGILDESELETIPNARQESRRKLESAPSSGGNTTATGVVVIGDTDTYAGYTASAKEVFELNEDEQAQALIEQLGNTNTAADLKYLRGEFAKWPTHDAIAARADVQAAYLDAAKRCKGVK